MVMEFGKFMASTTGRLLRIVAGIVLVAAGWMWIGGIAGIIVAVIGLVPLLAGIFDVCLISGLFLGTPYRGKDLRAQN
jgi:Inner membrane protein YgaP-like, transmembrane domain